MLRDAETTSIAERMRLSPVGSDAVEAAGSLFFLFFFITFLIPLQVMGPDCFLNFVTRA